MNMKTSSILLVALLWCCTTFTHAADPLSKANKRIDNLESQLKTEKEEREQLQKDLGEALKSINSQKAIIDSLSEKVNANTETIKSKAELLGTKIDEANTSLGKKADSSDVQTKTIGGGILLLILALLGSLIYYLLHKRINKGNANVEALKEKAEKINEDILNQFSHEMDEMQKISSSLEEISKSSTSSGGDSAKDHSLILTLADRITFMEMTLFRMDPSVKGHKPLSKSIKQMKDNLYANGYEIVEMLGKPYSDGMKVTANFIEDEDLEEGQRIITAVIKPQINYKGKMIQAANITVSQN